MSTGDYLENTRVFRRPAQTLIKIADVDLGENPQMWFAKIYGVFEAQHPEIYKHRDTVPSLTFSKQDFVSGYALGAMTIAAGRNMLVFPTIVRDGRLAPFDMVYVNGQLKYADKDKIESLVNPYQPFKGVSSFQETNGPDLSNDTTTTHAKTTISNKYAGVDIVEDLIKRASPVAEALESSGKYSLKDIGHTIKDEQFYKLGEEIVHNPAYFTMATGAFKNYVRHIDDMATKEAVAPDWCDVVMINRDDIDSYLVKKAKTGYDGYVEEFNSTEEIKKLALSLDKDPDAVLDKVDELGRTGGAVVINKLASTINSIEESLRGIEKLAAAGIKIASEPTFKTPGQIESYGPYNVLLDDGSYDTGTAFPLVDWNFQKSNNYLYVGSQYALQSRMAGQPSSAPSRAPRGDPREGAEGTFVYESGGRAFALPPFKVISHRHTPSGVAIMARSLVEEKLLNLVPTEDVNSLVKITLENDPGVYMDNAINVYVPTKMDFIVLPPKRGLVIEDSQKAAKLAAFLNSSAARKQSQLKVKYDGDGFYRLDMVKFPLATMPDKIASLNGFWKLDRRTEYLPDIYFNIKIAGVTSPDVISDAQEGRWNSIYVSVPAPDPAFCKEAKLNKNVSAWEAVKEELPYTGLFKVAAAVESSETLDELFALNFMNDDNVEYFLSNIGEIDEIEGFLARLLLGARVSGITNLAEDEIQDTLKGVVNVRKALAAFSRGMGIA